MAGVLRAEVNGVPARVEELGAVALGNYGHFTSMLVEGGGVRGLGLHLERLRRNARVVFGCALDTVEVREFIRRALGGGTERVAVRVTVFSRHLDRALPAKVTSLDVLVTTSVPPPPNASPLRLWSTRYDRELPHVKHVATFGQTYQRRLAQEQGFDDALFVDHGRRISEGTFWNIGFYDGDRVIWPSLPALGGVARRLVQVGLDDRALPSQTREVALSDLGDYRSAFVTNSLIGVRPVAAIDSARFALDRALTDMLADCWAAAPLERL